MRSAGSISLGTAVLCLGLVTAIAAQQPAPKTSAAKPARCHEACRFSRHTESCVATGSAQIQPHAGAASVADNNALVKKYCVGCHSDRNKDRAGSLTLASFDFAKAGQDADVTERMIRKLQASMMPPPGMPRPDPATYQSFIRALETSRGCARQGQPESRRPHVPAPESSRVHPRGQGSARARRRCRQVAAERHDERELRQHRRRTGAVADAARVVPERRGGHQPHGGRRQDARRRSITPTPTRPTCRSTRGIASLARRSARAAAWSSTTCSPRTANTSSR